MKFPTKTLAACVLSLSAGAFAQTPTRPDALLQIDLNRVAVIEKIMGAWSQELPASQRASFKDKLNTLRADQLLAANVSGTFDGVLEVMDAQEKTQIRTTAERAKAIGEADRDLIYTPITPCRFIDTRGVFSPVFAGGAYAPNETRPYQATGNCGIPTGAQAVVTQIIMITPTAAGDIEVLPQGATFGNTVAMVFQANVFSSVSLITRLNAANGQFATQIRGPGGNVAMDVTGYFMAPTRNGDGLRVIATAQGGPNIINGDSSNTITAPDRATISGGSDNTTVGIFSTIGGGGRNRITGTSSSGTGTTIGGGEDNTANGDRNTIAGGVNNTTGASGSTVGGGSTNAASGSSSTVPGGVANTASGSHSFAAGNRGKAINNGAFVWSDFNTFDFSSTAANQFSARAVGGFRFVSAIDATGAPTKTFAIAPTTGNVTTPGRIDATDDIASAADVTASGNISAGVDLLATRDVTATQNVVANNKFVASINKSSATGTKAIGDRFRDNSIIAWARVLPTGATSQNFGVTSVVRNGVGDYTITLDVTAQLTTTVVPIAIAQLDARPTSLAAVRLVAVNTLSSTTFSVYINNGSGAAVDDEFVVMVTGR